MNILITDDEAINVEILSAMLEDDFEVRVAYDGKTALAILDKIPMDVILLDIEMPEMNGIEVARQIRANPKLHDLKILLISGYSQEEIEQKLNGLEIEGLLSKPTTKAILTKTILAATDK